MKRLIALIALVFVTLAASPAFCAEEIDRIVAIVGSRVITLSELQTEMAPALADIQQRYRGDDLAAASDRLKRASLNNIVDRCVQLQEAKLEGIEVTDEEVNNAIDDIMKRNKMDMKGFKAALASEGYEFDDYKKSLAEQLTVMRLVSRAVKSRVSLKDSDITDYYNRNKEKFTQAASVRIANISFPAQAGNMDAALKNAEDARKQILAGTPFEEMAAKCTGEPNAAKTCVLGTFSKGELSADIETLAFTMNAGDVSEPIKGDKGYQLIKVMEKSAAATKTLAEARPQIVDELSSKQAEGLFADWIQDLRKRTYVEVRN